MQTNSIAFIAGQLGLGGAEKQLYLLVQGLRQKGWAISILTLNGGLNDYWESRVTKAGVTLTAIPRGPRWYRALTVAKELRKSQPRIVHGWAFHANPYANLSGRMAKVPLRIGTIREHPAYLPKSCALRFLGLFGLDGLLTNSQETANHLVHLYRRRPLPPVYTVNNGVVIPDTHNREKLRIKLADRWSVRADIPWLIGLGRLDSNKNWDLLLAACKILVKKGREFQLMLIGDGPRKIQLASMVNELFLHNVVRIVSSYPEADQILPAFDILCLSSNSEGLPNVIMEASAAGLPVVATAVGGISEIVENGRTGFLIPPYNTNLFVEHLDKLLLNPDLRCRVGLAGQMRMRSSFAVERMVDCTIKVYDDLLRRT